MQPPPLPQNKATSRSNRPASLAGIRILDLTRVLAGPSCTQLLGDLGADVIKVERPGCGDDTRSWGPPYVQDKDGNDTNESAYYLSANRNKRSIAIDLAIPKDAQLISALTEKCDILIENFKVGGLDKYGLGHTELLKLYPRLIYCSITGFGHSGPNAHRAGYDLMAQGYGGIMSLTGEPDGDPMKVGVGVADIVCGLYASTAILAALRHRDATGEGQFIDLALVDSQIAWLANAGTNYLMNGVEPQRYGNQHPNIVPYQLFQAADGPVIVAVGNDAQFASFCDLINRPELCRDSRYRTNKARVANRDHLITLLTSHLLTMAKATLIAGMEKRGIPGGPVHNLGEVFGSDQVQARAMKITMKHAAADTDEVSLIGNPLKFSKTPVSYRRAPPSLGEHTRDVLHELLGDEAASNYEDS